MNLDTLLWTAVVVAIGAFIVVIAGGWLVGSAIDKTLGDELEATGGIEGAGRAIGWAERTLIYVFILADAATAIGLLVAAKSILRIGDVTGDETDDPPGSRARTEYVIFGTLVSFAWAVSLSYLARWILETWIG